jgi:hypothetical protein
VRFEDFTAMPLKNGVFWDVSRVAVVRTDISEERIAFIIRVKKVSELGTTLAVTSNRSTLSRSTMYAFLVNS